ncbi:hypothetical protein BRARA_I04104 [Brassica rapa]|uniref:F-box associated domain-containing protein n=1 Tax=Brassica campestris TaxID=3711 RepID=A0A397Y2S6_BRACM|nr:hypothetical protein BRARA_I04104 [Brassica rapa]
MIESSYLAKKRLVRFPDLVLFLLKSEKFKDDQSSKTIFLKPYGVEEKITICSYKLPDRHCEFYHDHRARIVGYCDGLACIYHLGYIYIINTTIRKFRILSPDFLRNYAFLSGRSKSPMNVGFGKDIVTGAYKVVLMYLYDRIATKTLIKTHVFNLSNELFYEVLPPSCFTKYSNKVYLWSLKDRLCLCEVEDLSDVDIWGLQQEGSSVKWEKFLSDSAFSKECFEHPYWMTGVLTCYQIYEDASTALCTKDLAALL